MPVEPESRPLRRARYCVRCKGFVPLPDDDSDLDVLCPDCVKEIEARPAL